MSGTIAVPNGLAGLTFRHLQLHPELVGQLERRGLVHLGDLAAYPPEARDFVVSVGPTIRQRAALVARHASGGSINWPAFWDEGVDLYWMAMTGGETGFPEHVRAVKLASLATEFGALLNIPKATGIRTLGEIIAAFEAGSPPWRGFGALKVRRLGEGLHEIATGTLALAADCADGQNPDEAMPAIPALPTEVLAWNLDALGLGAGADKLKRLGRETVGSVHGNPYELWRLPGVGRRTVTLLCDRMRLLADAIVDGAVDLERLAGRQGVPFVPDGTAMVECDLADQLATAIRWVAVADGSVAGPVIFEHRICRSGSDAATLEEIAHMLPERLTRERVRQIEMRILHKAAGLLLSPWPTLGSAIIQPSLKARFRSLADALAQHDQINPVELGLLIAREWRCSLTQAMRALPMVMAVIEGTARTSAELRRLCDTPEPFFRPLEGAAKGWPAQNTGGERTLAQKLGRMGVTNLEELRRAWLAGRDFGRHEGQLRGVLEIACECQEDAEVLAERLAMTVGRTVIPEAAGEWASYIKGLITDVAAVIDGGTFWEDSALIFVERTARLPDERPTLAALGAKLGRIGVTVKKTETETLGRLASTFLRETGGYAQCVLRPGWLDMWQDMAAIFRRFPGDPRIVRRSIEQAYGVGEEAMTMAFPVIWAVLSGLPARESHGRVEVGPAVVEVLAPIRLTGFRAIH